MIDRRNVETTDQTAAIPQLGRGANSESFERLVDEQWPLIERVARELLDRGRLDLTDAVAQRIGLELNR